jgi:hypothetical protein
MTSERIQVAITVKCAGPDVPLRDDDAFEDEPTGRFVRVADARSHRWLTLTARVIGGAAGLALSWWIWGGAP